MPTARRIPYQGAPGADHSKGGTRKLPEDEINKRWPDYGCQDREHYPAAMCVFEPGLYEHTCPSCGAVYFFRVPRTAL